MTGQRLCRIVVVLACLASGAPLGSLSAQELIAQPRCDLLLIDLHSLRDDITVHAQGLADAPYLYKGWTQGQKVEMSTANQFAMLRVWDRALVENGRVESEIWQFDLMPTSPTALVIRSQGGRGTYEFAGVPLRNLSLFGQSTKAEFTFTQPSSQRLDLAWASVYDGELTLRHFLNARPQQVALRVVGSKLRLDLGGEPFAGEASVVVAGMARSLEIVVRRDVGLRVQAPPTVLRAFAAPHLRTVASGLQSQGFETAACRIHLGVEEAVPGVRVTWEGTAGSMAALPEPPPTRSESAPALTEAEADREFETQITAFLVLAARREYDAATEKLRILADLRPGDARLLFLENWLRAHPNLEFDVVPILGEAERFFREGLDYYVVGQREEALVRFREAMRLDPKLQSAATWARKTAEEIERDNTHAAGGTGSAPTATPPRSAGDLASSSAPPAARIVLQSAAPLFAVRLPAAKTVSTRSDRIEFSGQVGDDVGVDRIEIALNGEPIRDRLGEPVSLRPHPSDPDSSRQLTFDFAVPLRPGTNEVVLTAYDIDATMHRTSERFTVVRQPSFFRTGTFAMILTGIVILAVAGTLAVHIVWPRGRA